jgi:hypothetical protein
MERGKCSLNSLKSLKSLRSHRSVLSKLSKLSNLSNVIEVNIRLSRAFLKFSESLYSAKNKNQKKIYWGTRVPFLIFFSCSLHCKSDRGKKKLCYSLLVICPLYVTCPLWVPYMYRCWRQCVMEWGQRSIACVLLPISGAALVCIWDIYGTYKQGYYY